MRVQHTCADDARMQGYTGYGLKKAPLCAVRRLITYS